MPPSLEPSGFFKITTFFSNLVAMQSTDNSNLEKLTMSVSREFFTVPTAVFLPSGGGSSNLNSKQTMRFVLNVGTYIDSLTFLNIILPSDLSMVNSYLESETTAGCSFPPSTIFSGQTLNIKMRSGSTNFYQGSPSGSICSFKLYNVNTPPSSKPTDSIQISLTRNGF